jgi:hypothetical protein
VRNDRAVPIADVQGWNCHHGVAQRGVDCATVDPIGMDRSWHRREVGYGALIFLGLVVCGAALFTGRRRSSPSRPAGSSSREELRADR